MPLLEPIGVAAPEGVLNACQELVLVDFGHPQSQTYGLSAPGHDFVIHFGNETRASASFW